MLTFLMLVRLSTLCPSAVLQRLDRLVEPLRATCTTKVIIERYQLRPDLKYSGFLFDFMFFPNLTTVLPYVAVGFKSEPIEYECFKNSI